MRIVVMEKFRIPIVVKRQFRLFIKSKDLDKSLLGKPANTAFELIKVVNSVNVNVSFFKVLKKYLASSEFSWIQRQNVCHDYRS